MFGSFTKASETTLVALNDRVQTTLLAESKLKSDLSNHKYVWNWYRIAGGEAEDEGQRCLGGRDLLKPRSFLPRGI
jgi:hypothetical protein